MARQIHSLSSGIAAATAYEAQERKQDASVEPLLTALNGLLAQLSSRNRELVELSRCPEQRVAERTGELSEVNDKLRVLSQEDPLTGLPNRRHVMMQLKTMWAECGETGKPLSVLMIDVDSFKAVNDDHGHDMGDTVLVALARTLQHSVRTDDLVSRLGGDEFVVLCPVTDLDGALKISEQLQEHIGRLHVPTGNDIWDGSISIGAVARTPSMKAADDLVKAADESVYCAKKAGGNCVRRAPSMPSGLAS